MNTPSAANNTPCAALRKSDTPPEHAPCCAKDMPRARQKFVHTDLMHASCSWSVHANEWTCLCYTVRARQKFTHTALAHAPCSCPVRANGRTRHYYTVCVPSLEFRVAFSSCWTHPVTLHTVRAAFLSLLSAALLTREPLFSTRGQMLLL